MTTSFLCVLQGLLCADRSALVHREVMALNFAPTKSRACEESWAKAVSMMGRLLKGKVDMLSRESKAPQCKNDGCSWVLALFL